MNQFSALPTVTKNLLIINVIMLVVVYLPELTGLPDFGLMNMFSFHYFQSELFRPHQFVTYMFLHGGVMHLFGNMLALFIFGSVLERVWGPKKFLTFYIITGIGAALIHAGVQHYQLSGLGDAVTAFQASPSPEGYLSLLNEYYGEFLRATTVDGTSVYSEITKFTSEWKASAARPDEYAAYAEQAVIDINTLYTREINIPTVGASGAVFGLLAAFGLLFPNTELMMLFFPVPIKAKYFVLLYAGFELYLGMQNNPGDNVAHFAHLGGALFGFILVQLWRKDRSQFY